MKADNWLIAVAILGGVAFIVYIASAYSGARRRMDLNQVVPMLLECAGMIAAVKMMFLSFRLGEILKDSPLSNILDSASILIGGFIFLCATSYGVIRIILEAHITESRKIGVDESDSRGESVQQGGDSQERGLKNGKETSNV